MSNPIIGFKDVAQLLLLPVTVINDILLFINQEEKENEKGNKPELCLIAPEGLPDYLPRAGESAIVTDVQNSRVGLICKITFTIPPTENSNGLSEKQSVIIPFYYNWKSELFCIWDSNPEISTFKEKDQCYQWVKKQGDKISSLNTVFLKVSFFNENYMKELKIDKKRIITYIINLLAGMSHEQLQSIPKSQIM